MKNLQTMRNYLLLVFMFATYLCTAQELVVGDGGGVTEGENSYFENCYATFINRTATTSTEDNYRNNEDYYVTICPTDHDLSKKITVDFTQFELEEGFDFLEIYDDNRTQAVTKNGSVPSHLLIGTYTGNTSPGKVRSTRGCLTFHFTSDYSVVKSGWSAIVSCESGNNSGNCEAEEIECGQSYTGNTQYGSNRRARYDCAIGTWEGREVVYKITTTKRGDIKATLTTSSSLDLDIFILEDCYTNCVAKNTNGAGNATSVVRHNNAAAGDYYIVIDGQFSNTQGAFNLVVDCEDNNGSGGNDCYNEYVIQDLIEEMCTAECDVKLFKADYYGAPAFYKEIACPSIPDLGGSYVLDCNGNTIAYDGFWTQDPINHSRLTIKGLLHECNDANGGNDCLVADDFEEYYAGDNISYYNPSTWKKWNANVADGKVSTDRSVSGRQALEINRGQHGVQDVVLKLGNRTSGIYKVSWKMYINDRDEAYFNIQNNTNVLKQGGELRLMFENTYTSYQNKWFDVELYIDLDGNRLKLFLDDRRFDHEQAYYANLGGINFYTTSDAHFYVDDICMEEVRSMPLVSEGDSASARSRNNQINIPLVVSTPLKELNSSVIGKQETLSVYPNPTAGVTTLKLELIEKEAINITIYNQAGQAVKEMALGEQTLINQSIDLTNLPSGMYILKATGKTTNLSQKVLVQH